MQYRFIADIPNFSFSEFVTFSFLDAVFCNQKNKNEILDLHFLDVIGASNILKIHATPVLIYATPEDDLDFTSPESKVRFKEYLNRFQLSVKGFDTFLWFAKDTSVFCHSVFGKFTQGKNVTHATTIFTDIYTNSSGEGKPITLNLNDIDITKSVMNKLFEICPNFKHGLHSNIINYETEDNRIEKALKFVRAARSAQYLRAKLAMYMSALECLFSGQSSGELMFKVSIRTAYYLGADRNDRVSISSTIVAAYEIRSKYLHGGEPKADKKTKDVLTELSMKVDEIVRTALTKVIMEDSGIFLPAPETASGDERKYKNEAFEQFLKDLTYPKNI